MERLHMNEIREIIYLLRRQESNRAIARALKMSRNTVKKYRKLAARHGFLDPAKPLPSIEELGRVMIPPCYPRHMRSTVKPYDDIVRKLLEDKVEMQAIWQRLAEDYGYTGSYSSVRRYVHQIQSGAKSRNHLKVLIRSSLAKSGQLHIFDHPTT